MQLKPPPRFRDYDGASEASVPTGTWGNLESLIGEISREPFPINVLPPLVRDAVIEAQQCTQAPIEMVVSCALATASLAAQALADVRRARTLSGPISLWFLVAAESGERKSTVEKLLGRAVREFQDTQRELMKTALANHTATIAAWEAGRDATLAKMQGDAKGNKDIEGHRADLARLESEKPLPPRTPRLTYEDVTSERLGRSLAVEWPSGGIFSSEGGAVLGGHSMGKDSIARTLALLNKTWEGASHLVDRAQAASFAVRGARLSLSIQVQPHVLADFLDRDRGMSRGSGFLARFLIVAPTSTMGMRKWREIESTPALDAFSQRLSELLADIPPVDPERGLTPPMLDLSPEAKALWVRCHDEIEGQLKTSGDFAGIADVASKAADNVARLAAVLHVLQHGATGDIAADLVGSAARIVLWFLYSAKAILGPLAISREQANAAILDRWLIDRAKAEGVTAFSTRTLLNSGPNATRQKLALETAMRVLEDHGRVRRVSEGKRRTIEINPVLLALPDAEAA